ncbi:MAG TPA: hypothetical protein DCE23_05275 [Firmicutes bacterium]|nr:hypothetical protein [Bacillota bacterium]
MSKSIIIKSAPKFDPKNYSFISCNTSAAHTYGNVTAIMVNYIKSLFPDNYFKYIHTATKIAYREFDFRKNTNKDEFKKEKPMLIVKPRIILDKDLFMSETLKTTRYTSVFGKGNSGELMPFFEDKNRGMYIKYLLNRMCMEFECMVVTESIIEQINIATAFSNRIRQDKDFVIETALESCVPFQILDLVSNDAQIPIYDENNSVKRFLDYLNSYSGYPMTYKMKTSTRNEEFFRYYNAKMHAKISNLSVDDGSKNNFVMNTATMTFNVRVEFWGTGMYYYFTQKRIVDWNEPPIEDKEELINIFTQNLNIKTPGLPEGYNLYTTVLFQTDDDKDVEEYDSVDISCMMDQSTLLIIEYCKDKGLSIEPFLALCISVEDRFLTVDRDYYYDIDTNKIYIKNPNSKIYYRLFIYKNDLYINGFITDAIGNQNDVNRIASMPNDKDNRYSTYLAPHYVLEDNAVIKYKRKVITDLPCKKPIVDDKIYAVYYGLTKYLEPTALETFKEFDMLDVKINDHFSVTFKNVENQSIVILVPEEFNGRCVIKDDRGSGTDITNQFREGYIELDHKRYKFYISGKDTTESITLNLYFTMDKCINCCCNCVYKVEI